MRTPGPVRTFLLASLQSSFGNAIGYVALLLLAFDRFHSAWAVSLVLLADFLPAIALAPLFGAFADRFARRSLCVAADLLRCAACVGLSFAGSFTAILGLALGSAGPKWKALVSESSPFSTKPSSGRSGRSHT